MITELTRTINGIYDAANTTILFQTNPYLSPNNELTLYFTDNDSRISCTINSVTGNNVVVNFNDKQYDKRGVVVKTSNYGSGIVGAQDVWTFSFTNPAVGIIQAISTGGSSVLSVEVSTDKSSGWIKLGDLIVTAANSNTAYLTIDKPWPYGRLNITSIAANNSVKINKVI